MAAEPVTDADFAERVLASDVPVLVDFWAPWCPPCRQMSPVIEEISDEVDGTAKVYMLNVDENPATAAKYGVTSIPRFMFFRDGEEVASLLGARPKAALVAEFEKMAK
ncbi:thioredoxin [Nanchangia anserum]|uniref:Thioredoxin n=1 Tax=Nanchangia anserum TaxID=2692125 RepID=A0A8I0G7Z5_9ACTO|nr:thioredoxin [Nanchangia anserum]MBD3689565.1 thioredoxin [Nanchangia anserum]QOX81750.1 thioredoxin [Nanchangia anserum]